MTVYLILIAIIIGGLLQINLIGSRSFLVSTLDPIVAVYTGIIAGLLSTVFFRFFSTPRFKFAYFGFGLCLAQSIIYGSLYFIQLPDSLLAIIWITSAAFSIGLGKWLTVEMANKYLDPARSQSFFSYLSSFAGIGFIISFVILKILSIKLGPEETIITAAILYFLIAILIALGFFPRSVLEINFEKNSKEEITIDHDKLPSLKKWYSILCFLIGALNIIYGYLINVQLKFNLSTFDKINSTINNYTLISSVLIVMAGIILGQIIKRKRTSPIKVIWIAKSALLLLTIVAISFQQFELFILLEIAQKFIGQSLVGPSMQQIVNSFINYHKKIFISLQQLFYFTVTSPILAGLFYLTSKLEFKFETIAICTILIIFNSMIFFVLKKFLFYYKDLLITYIRSNIFVSKVLATQMLSFLRPKSFVGLMKKELELKQENYLRKTIIIGLGFSEDTSTTEIIKNEFNNEKEEVQIAVLNALSTQERFEGVSFLMDILSMKVLPKSFQVRLNATKLIAKLYNVKAIPIILEGLNDKDPRVVANVLETLSLFKNKDLIKYFIRFSQHDVARVRANALMGCYKYKKTRAIYEEVIKDSIQNNNNTFLPSLFYIIGTLKDKTFIDDLTEIASDQENLPTPFIAPLAYALICNKKKIGYKLAMSCFDTDYEENKEISFTHFFSQFTKVQRFDFVRQAFNFQGSPEKIHLHLKNSRFDFHEEVDYLKILMKAGL